MSAQISARAEVRRILSTLPAGRRADVAWLTRTINTTTGLVVDDEITQAALDWNHDRGFVQSTRNHEREVFEWALTPEGRNKEGLA